MLTMKIATLMKSGADEIAATWNRRAVELIGEARAHALGGDGNANGLRAIGLDAEFLKNELKLDDLRRWAADVGHHAHDAGLRSDQLLGFFITGRTTIRDFMLGEETFSGALDAHQSAQLIQRNAAFFDQAALFALGVHFAETKGHPHPADAPHLFK